MKNRIKEVKRKIKKAWSDFYWAHRGLVWVVSIVLILCLGISQVFGSFNKDWVEARAVDTWSQQGFEVVAKEGFQMGFGYGVYGGAEVWHRLKKVPDNGNTYSGFLQRWGDEIQVYGPITPDAIGGH